MSPSEMRSHGACLVMGPKSGVFAELFQAVVLPKLAHAMKATAGEAEALVTRVDFDQLREVTEAERALIVRRLAASPLAILDVSEHRAETYYLLGAREALGPGPTLACSIGAVPEWSMSFAKPTFVDLTAAEAPGKVAEALDDVSDPRQKRFASDLRRARVFTTRLYEEPAVLQHDEPDRFVLPSGGVRRIGLRCGAIQTIRDVGFWVNSENDRMQMARETDTSVSAIIRHLGANFIDLKSEFTDDAIAVALARAMGAQRIVPIGAAVVTPAPEHTPLQRDNGVLAVVHVATVRPVIPGGRFVSGGKVDLCVKNALAAAADYARAHLGGGDARNRAVQRSIVFPLLGAGDGGVPPELVASQMVGAIVDHAADPKADPWFETIWLLAYQRRDKDAILAALEAHGCVADPGAERAA